jgi:hypothetical protein
MRVTFEFLAQPQGTEVVVTHEGVPSDKACTVHEKGWEGTLERLEQFLEQVDTPRDKLKVEKRSARQPGRSSFAVCSMLIAPASSKPSVAPMLYRGGFL